MPKETDYYPAIIDVAKTWGWLVHHTRAAMRQSGKWSTPIMGHKGYPDFTFVHPAERIILFREIKGAKTTVEGDQKIWLAALDASGADVDIWRMPRDWDLVVATLSFGRGTVQLPML